VEGLSKWYRRADNRTLLACLITDDLRQAVARFFGEVETSITSDHLADK